MDIDIRQFYEAHLKQLGLREKLELMELLMQSTLDLVRKGEKEDEKALPEKDESTSLETEYTELQKQLLNGPVMAEEDYLLYQEKKQHFAEWK